MMTKRTAIIFSLLLVILAIILDPYLFGLCAYGKQLCLFDSLAGSVGKPLFFLSVSLFFTTLICIFFRKEIFDSWFRMTMWLFPTLVVIMFLIPEYGSAGIVSLDRDSMAFIFAILFFAASLTVVLIKLPASYKK